MKLLKIASSLCLLSLGFVTAPLSAQQIIRTIGGGYVGDGGPALKAGLYEVRRVAVSKDGTIYIADKTNNRVRRVTPDGVISTLAGNGQTSYAGDGGPAARAELYFPESVLLTPTGDLLVGDLFNYRIRRIAADGRISTYAGNGNDQQIRSGLPATTGSIGSAKGMTFDADGVLYIADPDYERVYKIENQILTIVAGAGIFRTSDGDGRPAVDAKLYFPYDVAVDKDKNLYVAEYGSHRIRRIDRNGIITRFAGTGQAGFSGDGGQAVNASLNSPAGLWFEGDDLYVVDSENNRIRRIRNGIITTVAGTGEAAFGGDGGPATQAKLSSPRGITGDGNGNLFISDTGNGRVRKLTPDGRITTVAGAGNSLDTGDGGAAVGAYFRSPTGLLYEPNGSVLVVDPQRHRIRTIDRNGLISTFAGTDEPGLSGDGGPAAKATFRSPRRIASDGKGNYYIADSRNHRVRKIDSEGRVSTFAGTVQGYRGDGGPATAAQLNDPSDVAVHPQTGEVYIADRQNHCIRKVDARGIITRVTGVCESAGFNGDSAGALQARLRDPYGIGFAPNGDLLIADTFNYRVRRVRGDAILTVAGTGVNAEGAEGYNLPLAEGQPATQFNLGPVWEVESDSEGNLFLLSSNFLLRVNSRTQGTNVLSGSRQYGFSVENGLAGRAIFNNPQGLAVSDSGDVAVADDRNGRIRLITSVSATTLITFRTDPPNGRVLVDSTEVADGTQLRWIPGSKHTIGAAPIRPFGNSRLVFSSWNTGDTNTQTITTPAAATTYTATFSVQHRLEVIAQGNGTVTQDPVSPDSGFYNNGTNVRLSAEPGSGWNFEGFSGTGVDGDTVSMTAPRRVVATFRAPVPDLSVSPANLLFRLQAGGAAPAEQMVTIASTGTPLNFAATASENFVRVSTNQTGTPAIARVSINPSGLNAGRYTATLSIRPAEGATVVIPVQVEVTPAPAKPDFTVDPEVISLTMTAGTQSQTRTVAVGSTGTPIRFGWNVRSGAQWLRVASDDSVSTTPATVRLTIEPSGLSAGSYSGRVELVSSDAANSPRTILVNLDLQAETLRQITVAPASLNFQHKQRNSSQPPAPEPAVIDVVSNVADTRFYLRASVASSTAWLSASTSDGGAVGTAPAPIQVRVQPEGLTPGTYEGSIEIRLSQNGEVVTRVPVRMEVVPPPPPELVSERTEQRFELPLGGPPQTVVWTVENHGEEPVTISASASEPWLKAMVDRAIASDSDPSLIRVVADASGLAPGTYAGSVVARAGGVELPLAVVLAVNRNARTIVAAQTSMSLSGRAGTQLGASLVDLLVTGQGTASWSSTVSTESGGNWLSVSPPSGSIEGGRSTTLRVNVDGRSLTAGVEYAGRIQIRSPQTDNIEEVVVRVNLSNSQPPPELIPSGIVLTATQGGAESDRKTIGVRFEGQYNATATLTVGASASAWLRLSTNSVRLNQLAEGSFTISAVPGTLAPGVYRGNVLVEFQSPNRVNLLAATLVVTAPGGQSPNPAATGAGRLRSADANCQPTKLLPVFALRNDTLRVRVGDSAQTDFVIVDDCGRLFSDGAVSNSFSTGDRPVDLRHIGDGVWRATWVPRRGEQGEDVELQINAIGGGTALSVQLPEITTALTGVSLAPILDAQRPFVSPGSDQRALAVAPGGRVIIRGARLAATRARSATGVEVLSTTRVTIGGTAMRLVAVAPDEIEGVIPDGLPVNIALPVVVARGNLLSSPEMLVAAETWPTVVSAGQRKDAGLDLVLTGVDPKRSEELTIQVGTAACPVQRLEPITGEPGLYYSKTAGCSAAGDTFAETATGRTSISRVRIHAQAGGRTRSIQ